MNPHPIVGEVATLTAADLAGCDRAAASELLDRVHQVRSWLDAVEAVLVGRVDPTVLGDGRRSSRETRTVATRGEVCADMPALHDALASGTVAAGHVDAVARVAGQVEPGVREQLVEHAAELVETAAVSSVDWFERHVRDLARHLSDDDGLRQRERLRRQRFLRRWSDRETGLCHTHLALDPEADARLSASLDAAVAAERAKPEIEARTFDQLRADAFLAAITGPRTGERRPAEVSVLIDIDTLADGTHDHSVCETSDGQPLPPESVRRIACDATIIPLVMSSDGVVLDHGRGRRVATESQRRALRAMYRTCGFPDCTVRFADCEIHHVVHWIRQRGPTDMDNLLPLCSQHHHAVHDAGWHITLHPDRTLTVRGPDGSVAFDGSTVDVALTGCADDELSTALRARIGALVAQHAVA